MVFKVPSNPTHSMTLRAHQMHTMSILAPAAMISLSVSPLHTQGALLFSQDIPLLGEPFPGEHICAGLAGRSCTPRHTLPTALSCRCCSAE